jgi:hypothetical protein
MASRGKVIFKKPHFFSTVLPKKIFVVAFCIEARSVISDFLRALDHKMFKENGTRFVETLFLHDNGPQVFYSQLKPAQEIGDPPNRKHLPIKQILNS